MLGRKIVRSGRQRHLAEAFVRRITCVRPCHTADLYACVAAAWQPRAALEAKSEHPRRSRREGQPQELPAASIDPTADDSLLCYEQALPGAQVALRQNWLPSTSASAARRCREGGGRRLHDDAVVARFRRVVCGARHARRWWGQKLWMFEASWGSSAGSRGLSWRFGAGSGGEETRRRGAGVTDGLGAF